MNEFDKAEVDRKINDLRNELKSDIRDLDKRVNMLANVIQNLRDAGSAIRTAVASLMYFTKKGE